MLHFEFEHKGRKFYYKEVATPTSDTVSCEEQEMDMLICLTYNGKPILNGNDGKDPYPFLIEDVYGYIGEDWAYTLIETGDYKKGKHHWRMIRPEIIRLPV